MEAKEQLNQLSNDLEGYLNDFEAGLTSTEDTISGLIDYVLKRVEISNKFKLNKIIEGIEGMKKYPPDTEKDLSYFYTGLDEVTDIIKKELEKLIK